LEFYGLRTNAVTDRRLPADVPEQLLLQEGHIVITRSLVEAKRVSEAHAPAPVVWIRDDATTESTQEHGSHPGVIELRVSTLAPALAIAIASSLDRALASIDVIDRAHVVAVSSKRSFEKRRESIHGSLVLLTLRSSNLRTLGDLIDLCRAQGCRGVQVVWDGENPTPSRAAPRVFSALEQARSTPSLAPVWIATSRAPLFHLLPPRPRTDEETHAHV
jgi:hypothetical protein